MSPRSSSCSTPPCTSSGTSCIRLPSHARAPGFHDFVAFSRWLRPVWDSARLLAVAGSKAGETPTFGAGPVASLKPLV